jgi:hypothetical protein
MYNIHVTTVAMEKQQTLNIMSVFILALFIHHTMCLCHVILLPVACLSGCIVFLTLSYKWHDFC